MEKVSRMKLLMITRKVDRSEHLAGFIYNWVEKLAGEVEELRVISWQEGDSSGLPDNVKVTHLKTKQSKFLKAVALKKIVWKNLKYVDGIFCHQMPIYTIIAAPLAKIRGKRVVSWYMHKQVDLKMRLMTWLADTVLSASKESFRLKTKKLVITGHGIDTELFKPGEKQLSEKFEIVSVGRISPTKDYESMIKAVQHINNIELYIIGEAGLKIQKVYFDNLKQMIDKMNLAKKVKFLGAKPNSEIPKYLKSVDLFINLSGTGSLDKAVLEAMASGCLVLTSNESFQKILPKELMVEKDNPKALTEKIEYIMQIPEDKKSQLRQQLRQEVVANHNLENLVKKIVEQYAPASR